ncbi:MAG TPA: DUF5009 domain-containing protein [archaeon]|nr:DUF5009 domain-containing protein [archaeon]
MPTPVQLNKSGRLVSLDAYRGFIMLCFISVGFGLRSLRDNPGWEWLARQFMHVEWQGIVFDGRVNCVFWDLILPMFLFIVGVAMPFAFAARTACGQSRGEQLKHLFKRALTLLLIGMILNCILENRFYFPLSGILQNIAIAYFCAFFVQGRGIKVQIAVAMGILVFFWAINQFWPGVGPEGPWARNANNFGAAFNHWFHGLFGDKVSFSLGGFHAASTVIFGIVCGECLMKESSHWAKLRLMIIAGVAGVIIALVLNPFIPIGKPIGAISYWIYSIGWSFLVLSLFYWLIEVKNYRKWSFIFQVVGMNSIFIYVFKGLMYGSINKWLLVFTGSAVAALGDPGTILQAFLVLAVEWYVTYWLYKHKIFIKVG